MSSYGYARVSSKEQNPQRQLESLRNSGLAESAIFIDYESGKNFKRTEYQHLKELLRPKDLLVITSIDRLGRNYNEIQNEWRAITKEIGANVRVLDLPLLDTTRGTTDLTSTFIADLVLSILSYVAEQERINIRQRQAEGIALAKTLGKHLGRPPLVCPKNFDVVYTQYKNGDITLQKALKELNLKRSSFFNLAKQVRNK